MEDNVAFFDGTKYMYVEQILLKESEKIITSIKDVYIECKNLKKNKYDELILTNTRLIAFSHNSNFYIEIYINDILIKNNWILCEITQEEETVVEYDDDLNEIEMLLYHYGMQFRTTYGLLIFTFDKDNSKDLKYSKDIINNIFLITNHPIPKTVNNSNNLKSFVSGLFSNDQEIIHKLIIEREIPTTSISLKNIKEQRMVVTEDIISQSIVKNVENKFCPNCGAKLRKQARFCSNCGKKVESIGFNETKNIYVENKKRVYAAKELFNTIQNIDEQRIVKKKNIFDNIGYEKRVEEANRIADQKILAVIESFPIPNDIDEICDLFDYACDNIDIKASKRSFLNNISNGNTKERALSDVWVDKLKQIYKMGKDYYESEKKFKKMQTKYYVIMEELNML